MKIILFILFSIYCFTQTNSQDKTAEFKKQIKNFTKIAQGLYIVLPTETQKQEQALLFFPINDWNTNEEAWFVFIWLSPKYKDKPLEVVFNQVTYKNADTMAANYYKLPENAPNGLLLEWRKAKPYSPMTADFVKTESLPCEGYISIEKDGVYNMNSYAPCPSDTKGAGYTSISVASRFISGQSYASGVKFYAPDGKIIIEQNYSVKSKKTKSNLKQY